MRINDLVIEVQDVIMLEEHYNLPFVEYVNIPLEDWEDIKNYIDEQIKSKKDANK